MGDKPPHTEDLWLKEWSMIILNVARWFLEKEHATAMVDELLKCDMEVVKSTEKAVLIRFHNENIDTEVWTPKKVVTFKK